MDEGKPTKAKWWSRPRAHGAGAGATGDHTGVPADAGSGENAEGDFELERPTTAPARGGADTTAATDTDFELARPAAEAPLRPGSTSDTDTDGDFELERPASVDAGRGGAAEAARTGDGAATPMSAEADEVQAAEVGDAQVAGASSSALGEATTRLGSGQGNGAAGGVSSPTSGEAATRLGWKHSNGTASEVSSPVSDEATAGLGLGLEKNGTVPPAAGAGETTRSAVREVPTAEAGVPGAGVPEAAAQRIGEPGVPGSAGATATAAATAVAATAVTDARPLGETDALSAPGGPSERPKPLHDPDPYSTPPYGEPGPWAPAPPVQHPATTPAHGTNVQSATPAHGVPASVGAPTHGGATSEGAAPHGGATSVGGPTPAGATSASALTHSGATPATAPTHAEATSAAPQPSLVTPANGTAVPPTTPQPTTAAPYRDAPQPGAAPYPETAPSVTAPYAEAPRPAAASYSEASQPAAAPFPEASQPAAGPFPEASQPAQAPYPEASQPAAAPFPEAPRPAAAPYPDAAQPSGASYAYPSQPGPPPFRDAAQGVPPPYVDGAQPTPPAYADPSQPVFADAAQAVPQGPQGPWQNYDPWAGSGSLQQNGAGVADVARRRRRRVKALLVGALLIAVVAGGIGGAAGAYLERNGGAGEVELPQAGDGVTGRAPDSVAGIAASALPGVVTLHVSGASAQGTGTGFVLDERGHILTNNHVVDPAGTSGDISVTFSGGETAKATIVGRDTGYDLAVVKVSGVRGLKPLPLGNSDEVQVGDPVVAIGAPFDLANTVTSGIISAKQRPITAGGEGGDVSDVSYVDALQTDAPINPGNSGGPLLDGKARVIGINSAIRSAGSGSESDGGQAGSIGLGFAIPINQGKRVAEELINTGKATHPVIGVTLDMDYAGDGARIGDEGSGGGSAVTAGGPADRAGIRSGDVITEVDGQRVHSGDELIVKVRAHRPGDRLELTLLRSGKEQTVTLTLGSSDGG